MREQNGIKGVEHIIQSRKGTRLKSVLINPFLINL